MRIETLERERSFALLGPGFAGRPVLLTDLRRVTSLEPADLVFLPYETRGRDGELYAGERTAIETIELPAPAELEVSLEAAGHGGAVGAIREAIARGDVYQVCLTLRAHLPLVSGAALLSRMADRGLPRFLAWVRFPDGRELVSASPELLVGVTEGRIRSEPMKGTAHPAAGGALETSEKDRAELAMITDLVRNELAQVCLPRSVRVLNERRFIELPYAVQTVADVEGELRRDVTLLDALDVLHPGGSVTGAPKTAARRMIEALEPTPRGAYCGALGLLGDRAATVSLLIRTAQRTPDGWMYGAGGGIVYDSDPSAELAEVYVKLGALASVLP